MPSEPTIVQACENLQRSVEAFRAAPQQLGALRKCLDQLQALRDEYRRDKAAFEPHLERLRELSNQVHEAIASAVEALAAQYLEAVAQIGAWQDIREACRDGLAELAKARKITEFNCAAGVIEARPFQSMKVPEAASPQRQELCDLITEAGRWPDVASPIASRLLKALSQGLFTPQQAGRLAELCPLETHVRLVGKGGRR
jgi:hypothetical protein